VNKPFVRKRPKRKLKMELALVAVRKVAIMAYAAMYPF
jgi:hypothetical protein